VLESYRQIAAILKCGPRDPIQRLVLIAIADSADPTGFAFPGVALLQAKCCLCKRAVLHRLAELERDGWLVINRKAARDHKGNTYQIVLSKLRAGQVRADAPENEKSGAPTRISQVHLQTKSGASTSIAIRKNNHEQPDTNTEADASALPQPDCLLSGQELEQ